MGKAVQYPLSLGQPPHRSAVVLLVQKEPCLLTIFKIHGVFDSILNDFRESLIRETLVGKGEKSLALGQPLLLPQRLVISLVNAPDILPILPQGLQEERKKLGLPLFHTVG